MTSLKAKILLIVMSIFALFGIVNYAIQRMIIFPGFVALERDEARKDIARCVQALQREIHHLDALCHDWSAWDDTYEFVQTFSADYVNSNLVPEALISNELHLLYIVRENGAVMWRAMYDFEQKTPIEIADFPNQVFPANHPLLAYETTRTPLAEVAITGIFMTERGPMLIASRPILDSENQGPMRGSLIMGRLLNDALIQTLVEQTQVDFQVFPILPGVALSTTLSDILYRLTPENPYLIVEHGAAALHIDTLFPDINGNPALILQALIPRKISARGASTTRYAVYSLFAAALILLLALLRLLQKFVLTPILNVTQHVVAIGKTGDLSAHLLLPRRDEIGVLAHEFDQMLAQLAAARKQLLQQSHDAGMAELASGILHNVRNALIPLVGTIEQIRSEFDTLPIPELMRAQDELSTETLAAERRAALINFSLLANRRLITIIADANTTLRQAMDIINQIEQILVDYEHWAYHDQPTEPIQIAELAHDAFAFLPKEKQEALVIHLDPGVAEIGVVMGKRTTLLQVFINIFMNAAEAIQSSGAQRGDVSIDASCVHEGEQAMIHLQIRDTGSGMAAEILTHIFERGFSTKSRETSGIGLHWCANAMTAMQGRITAESGGPGQGACFHLWLPQGHSPQQGGLYA